MFSDDALLALLSENDVSQIVMIGIDGCCCAAASAKDARALGFEVTIPTSCIGVKNHERFTKKRAELQKLGVCISE